MERYSDFIFKYRWLIIIVTIMLVGLTMGGLPRLSFKSDYKAFFKKDNKQLKDFQELQDIYSKSDSVSFIVVPENGQVFNRKTLTAIWELTNKAWLIKYNSRVDSIANYQYSYAEGDDLMIEDLILDPDDLNENRIKKIKQIVLSEPLLVKKLISENGDAAVVNITIRLPGIDKTREVPEVANEARKLRDELKVKYPDIKFMLSGMIMMNTSFSEASKADSMLKIPVMLLVVLLSVGILLRTVSGTIATLIVIIFSVIGALGIWGWLGGYLTGPSSGSPTVILTLAVADCVHILSTTYHNMRQGMDKIKAIKDSLRINMQPVFLTSLTTAIGFLTMNFSDAPPFGHLGNIVAMGVSLAFIFAVTVFPAMLMVFPLKAKIINQHHSDTMAKLANFVIRHRKALLIMMTLIIVGFSSLVPKNELNDDFVKYFDKSVPFRQATDLMQKHISGMTTLELSFNSKKSSGINDPKFIKFVDDFVLWLRSLPETDNVNSITDTLKRLNKNMHGDHSNWYKLPQQQELAAQYLLLYELSLPQGLDVNNQLNVDKSSTRVLATFKNLTTNHMLNLEKKVKAHFSGLNSDYELKIASPSLMFAHIGASNIRKMLKGSILALILISVLLGIALKSVKFGLISLLPNLTPAAVSFGIWGVFVGQVGLGLSVVTGLTMGIIVDDTVHFLSKYIRARREKNLSSEDAIRYSFTNVGRALWITSAVLIAGFMVMASSSFKMNAELGLLTAITILIALLIDFLFLPPLILLLKSRKENLQH